MRALFDICHPAHAHFFKYAIERLLDDGHEVLVTSRTKEMATQLLDAMNITHLTLSAQRRGALALLRELVIRDGKLYKAVRQFRPDVMAAIGGIFIAHVGRLSSVPALVFYDTENARLQNLLTYPLASRVVVPKCYAAWVPRGKTIRYRGYHELAYLAPAYFTPDRERAVTNGLAATGKTFLLRLVSWQASHDIGETGWSYELLDRVVQRLSDEGHVVISSESELPAQFERFRYHGQADQIHHVMAFCAGFVGESATMASECAVLGVPAVYAAGTGRGYTDEQEKRYQLVRNVREVSWTALQPALDWLRQITPAQAAAARRRLLQDSVDVTRLICDALLAHPRRPQIAGLEFV